MTTTAPVQYGYRYGGCVTTVTLPLPMKHRYTKGQQALVDAALSDGWELDLTAILNSSSGRFSAYTPEQRVTYLSQNPFQFVKPAADGGRWEVELDYTSRDYGWYGPHFNSTLKGAKLRRYAADGSQVMFSPALSGWASGGSQGDLILERQSTAGWASTNYVTAVTSGKTLRDQVISLLNDPEAVATRAVEARDAAEAKEAVRNAEIERIRELKKRPLPAGWDALQEAAQAVAEADGLSDTEALLAALKGAVASVELKAKCPELVAQIEARGLDRADA